MFPDRKKKTVDFPCFNACYLSGRESNLYFLVLKCVTRVERNGIDISVALKYVIRQSADIPLLNKAWRLLNRLTPHPGKSENDNLTRVLHVLDLKKNFVKKLELLKRSRFLAKDVLMKFYFNVILPSINYGLVLWSSCCNSDITI